MGDLELGPAQISKRAMSQKRGNKKSLQVDAVFYKCPRGHNKRINCVEQTTEDAHRLSTDSPDELKHHILQSNVLFLLKRKGKPYQTLVNTEVDFFSSLFYQRRKGSMGCHKTLNKVMNFSGGGTMKFYRKLIFAVNLKSAVMRSV